MAMLFSLLSSSAAASPAPDASSSALVLNTHDATTHTIVSHHKSGTFAAFAMLGSCCCSEAAEDFWSTWSICSSECERKDWWLCNNGLHSGPWSIKMSGQKCTPNRNVGQFTNFIRHPVDVVVSGYLYHRSCNEAASKPIANGVLFVSSAEAADEMRKLLGASKNDPRSYCDLLQSNSATAGIEAELVRTMSSENGLAPMLRDFDTLEAAHAAGTAVLRTVCLASVTPGVAGADASWKNITGSLGCRDVNAETEEQTHEHHSTSADSLDRSRDELRSMAKLAILARFTDEEKQTMDRIATLCPVESTATARLHLARTHGLSTKARAHEELKAAENFYDEWA